MRAVIDLMARSIRYQLAVALPVAILLGIFAHPLLALWVGERLATDLAGIPVSEALDLASEIVWIMLAARVLRAGVYGTERILYGMGGVRSYAWFSNGAPSSPSAARRMRQWLAASRSTSKRG